MNHYRLVTIVEGAMKVRVNVSMAGGASEFAFALTAHYGRMFAVEVAVEFVTVGYGFELVSVFEPVRKLAMAAFRPALVLGVVQPGAVLGLQPL